ncbi:MAG: polysaccharide biosynthesis protein [Firmicutes bacterium]|nr:polysaccharide biosynthesis protein [Bacillota bacterium]MCM1401958.1 polysaccharide biosynthesis protein [Bacteroides sp.]MCM1477900.1 polysaccharide biosynthesis protein [Bacteroides sp.]
MQFIHRAASRYFSRQALPYWSILLLDCLFILLSEMAVYTLHHGVSTTIHNFWNVSLTMAVYLIPYIVGFRIFHTYSGIIRFSSFVDLRRIGFAMLFGVVVNLVIKFSLCPLKIIAPVRIADIVLSALLAAAMMWTTRIWVKTLYDTASRAHRNVRVFIYGVRAGGVALAKSINSQSDSPYVITGFISDGSDMVGRRLMDVPVYANDEHLVDVMKKNFSKVLLVSPLKSENLRNNEAMVNRLIEAGIRIMAIPEAKEWDGKSELSYTQLKDVNVEDLLPREKIEVDMEAVGNLLRGKRILITGAAGSIGSEMVRQIAVYSPAELLLVDQAETPLHDIRLMMKRFWPEIKAHTVVADIANEERMEDLFSVHKPEYVFHAAAYKHVPMMEDNPYESIENNVNGTRIIADLAVKHGTKKFVMVSTDKAVNPTNVMGCSKRICEIYVQSLDKAIKDGKVKGETCFVTTRFGNVLGSNGSVIPLFEKQIKAGGPVTVTHPDIIRYFMLIPEACKLVLEAGTMGNGGEIYVFDMGNPVRIADLARRMIMMSGAKNIEIKYTGLRDGEKLYEEVLNDKEVTLPTFHQKIKIAKVREYDYQEVNVRITELITTASELDDMSIVALMKAIVPEFKSQHSKYEALDK